jgi:hypothetical protein
MASRPSVQSHAADIRSVGGAQGWNIDQLAGLTGRSLVQLLRQHGTRSGPGTVCLGTLLGPEGTGGSPLRTSDSRSRPSGWDLRVHGTAPFVERPARRQHASRADDVPVRDETGSGLPPVP